MGFSLYFFIIQNLVMKRFLTIFFLCLVIIAGCSCIVFVQWVKHHGHFRDGDISFQVKESDDRYQVYASYDRDRTAQIQRYLDYKLHTKNLFRHSRIDADIVLEDNTKLYVKNTPGRLVIKFDRGDNSEEAYHIIKELTQGLKIQITSPQ
jgi:hypothetical protein